MDRNGMLHMHAVFLGTAIIAALESSPGVHPTRTMISRCCDSREAARAITV